MSLQKVMLFFNTVQKMSKGDLNFNNIEVKKSPFHNSKYLININKVDIEKIVNTNKISYGKNGLNTLLVKKMMIEIIRCVHCLQK